MKSSNTHILMLLENNPYPHDYRVRREAISLQKAGYHVSVISPAEKKQVSHEIIDGVQVYRYRKVIIAKGILSYIFEYGFSLLMSFYISLIVLFRHGFDIVHTHNPPDTFGLIAGFYKLLGKKFVYDHHDLSPELFNARFQNKGNRLIFNLLIIFEKFSCRIADHVIATNQSYKQVEMERDGVPEDHITIVRNGPVKETIPNNLSSTNNFENRILCYVGVMGPQDGVDYLIRSLHSLVYQVGRTEFHCYIVGTGDAVPNIISLSNSLDLANYITFTGLVNEAEVSGYIAGSDICLAPEPSDPYNDRSTAIKVMEYMSHGKPVVAFDLPEHRYSAQASALYAKPNDEYDFAVKISMLMDDQCLRKQLGDVGKERIEKELSWKYQERRLLAAYQSVIN